MSKYTTYVYGTWRQAINSKLKDGGYRTIQADDTVDDVLESYPESQRPEVERIIESIINLPPEDTTRFWFKRRD